MTRHLLRAALIALLPATAFAGNTVPAMTPMIAEPAPVAPLGPKLVFSVRGGASADPTYFGSKHYEASPSGSLSFEFLRLGGRSIGSDDWLNPSYGLSPTGSLRIVKARSSKDHAELAGLNDIDMAVELGLGLNFTSRNFEAFGVARYGVVGHEAWVGEVGANVVLHPSDRLTLRAGPRLFMADNSYTQTYYGVTAAESVASGGAFAAYTPTGGTLRAGVEVGATYALSEKWGLAGEIRYDRLLNDAADSPITAQGSKDQFSIGLGLTRRFTLGH